MNQASTSTEFDSVRDSLFALAAVIQPNTLVMDDATMPMAPAMRPMEWMNATWGE